MSEPIRWKEMFRRGLTWSALVEALDQYGLDNDDPLGAAEGEPQCTSWGVYGDVLSYATVNMVAYDEEWPRFPVGVLTGRRVAEIRAEVWDYEAEKLVESLFAWRVWYVKGTYQTSPPGGDEASGEYHSALTVSGRELELYASPDKRGVWRFRADFGAEGSLEFAADVVAALDEAGISNVSVAFAPITRGPWPLRGAIRIERISAQQLLALLREGLEAEKEQEQEKGEQVD